jgi:hypothetical protein
VEWLAQDSLAMAAKKSCVQEAGCGVIFASTGHGEFIVSPGTGSAKWELLSDLK